MSDVKTVDEGGQLHDKRKLDLPESIHEIPEDEKDSHDSSKRQKIEVPAGEKSSAAGENSEKSEDDEEDGDWDEDVSAEAQNVDRKGKGIMIDRKGKGKMIEDSEDEDSDGHGDDDGGDSNDDSDSDLSDGLDASDMEEDPLAEVDLDNILPSRTRRSRVQPGVRISNNPDKGNDE